MSSAIQQLVEAIQTAAADDASEIDKARGAEACRMLGALFGTKAGEPLAPAVPAPTPLAQAIDQARGASSTVLLDGLIAKLRSYVPDDLQESKDGPSLKVPFVPIPTRGRSDGE